MSFDLTGFESDKQKENEGIWQPVGGDAEILVASASFGNKKWTKAIKSIPPHHARQLQRGSIPEDTGRDLWAGLLADAILLDWKHITENGKAVKYSKEVAKQKLIQYEDFFDLVWGIATNRELFRPTNVEEDIKNS